MSQVPSRLAAAAATRPRGHRVSTRSAGPTGSRGDHRCRHLCRSARPTCRTPPRRRSPRVPWSQRPTPGRTSASLGRAISVVRAARWLGDRPMARFRTFSRTYAAASTFTVRREWPLDCPGSLPEPGDNGLCYACTSTAGKLLSRQLLPTTSGDDRVVARDRAHCCATSSRGFAFFGSNVENRRRLPATSSTWMDVHNGTADDGQVHR